MPSPQDLRWYASQSAVTSPGNLVSLVADIPVSIDRLRQVAHCLVIHYRDDRTWEMGIAQSRLRKMASRYGERMLARLTELQAGSLLDPRPPRQRLVGCCR